MKKILILILGSVFLIAFTQCNSKTTTMELSILVVTGGHEYDTAEFVEMFDAMENLETEYALKPEAWKLLDGGETYDAIVFYDMWQDISEKEKQVFLNEFENGTGMVFLHHSLASHDGWTEYTQLVGGKYILPGTVADTAKESDYRHDLELHVKILDPGHPVTEGVGDFDILDEGYSNVFILPGVDKFLETNHPDCDRYIGWSHNVRNSRVVYLMGGHDKHAFANSSFRKLIFNALRWASENTENTNA